MMKLLISFGMPETSGTEKGPHITFLYEIRVNKTKRIRKYYNYLR